MSPSQDGHFDCREKEAVTKEGEVLWVGRTRLIEGGNHFLDSMLRATKEAGTSSPLSRMRIRNSGYLTNCPGSQRWEVAELGATGLLTGWTPH